jgi:hypothetical protein
MKILIRIGKVYFSEFNQLSDNNFEIIKDVVTKIKQKC